MTESAGLNLRQPSTAADITLELAERPMQNLQIGTVALYLLINSACSSI